MVSFCGFAPLRETTSSGKTLIIYFHIWRTHLGKSERIQANETESTPGYAWLIGTVAWFVPGIGHALQKRWFRAALMGGAVWLSFFLGLSMGGHLFDLSAGQVSSTLLQVPPMIANLGTGALYIVSWLLGTGFAD